VLRTEAASYSLRPKQFAEFLLRSCVGLPSLEPRSPDAPQYEFDEGEVRERSRFVWKLRLELVPTLERARLLAGGLQLQTWMIFALNRWLGRTVPVVESARAA
jgi:hypothetical protein